MQVTNGSVTFGRTVKPADYEGKKAEVTLAFAIADGEDPEGAVAQVSVLAHDRAMVMLAMADRAVGAIPMPAPVVEQSTAAQPTGNVKEPTKRARRNLSEVVIGEKHNDPADIGGAPNSTPTAPPSPPATPPSGDPADIGGSAGPAPEAGGGSAPVPASGDPATIDDWETPKAEVPTQEQLTTACQEANGRLGNPVPIRALVAEFVGPPPKGVKDIPEAKRADFLAKLRALQPVAKAA